jgi:hypothetical protein
VHWSWPSPAPDELPQQCVGGLTNIPFDHGPCRWCVCAACACVRMREEP